MKKEPVNAVKGKQEELKKAGQNGWLVQLAEDSESILADVQNAYFLVKLKSMSNKNQ